jgi:small subunit ribosomal protein S17
MNMPKKRLQGIIVSDKMKKTVVVKTERIKEHPKYKKRYRISKRYKAHLEKGEYHIGDKVLIEECRPISKDKKWRVIGKA